MFALLSALWAAVFFGLRYVLGSAPPVETIGGLFARNMIPGALIRTALRAGLIFGAFWVFAIAGFRRAPAFAKRVAFIVPLYLCAIILWGVWGEVRLLMPLYPVVIPLALSFVFRDSGAAASEAP